MNSAPAPHPERGAGTVLTLAVMAVLLVCATALAALGSAQQAAARARAAADLGALAGAGALRWGADPCTTAARTVERNGAGLVACQVAAGGVVTVTVARSARGVAGWGGRAEATARAGPASTPAADDGLAGAARDPPGTVSSG